MDRQIFHNANLCFSTAKNTPQCLLMDMLLLFRALPVVSSIFQSEAVYGIKLIGIQYNWINDETSISTCLSMYHVSWNTLRCQKCHYIMLFKKITIEILCPNSLLALESNEYCRNWRAKWWENILLQIKELKVTNNMWTLSPYHCKSVSKAYPFLFYKNFKPLDSSVIAVQHKHSKCSKLCCSIPAIAAMYHHRSFTRFNFICNSYCSGKKHLKEIKTSILNVNQNSTEKHDFIFLNITYLKSTD